MPHYFQIKTVTILSRRMAHKIVGGGLFVWLLFSSQLGWAHGDQPPLSAPPNFYVVDHYVMRGAQPSKHHVQWLQRQGVHTIIKLDDENEEEFEWGIPIQWFHINKFGLNLSYGLVKSILHSLYRSMHWGKIYVHCERGADRTGLIIALYRVTQGWTIQQAWNEMNHPRFGHSALQVWIDYKFFEYAERLEEDVKRRH